MGMMKKLIVLLIVIIVAITGFFYWKKSIFKPETPSNVLSETDTSTPSPSPSVWPQSIIINIDNIPIRVSWTIIYPKNVELYSNLKEQKLSEEIKVNKSCKTLVSGGFYSKENKHLGLFISNFEEISEQIQSATLNGFMWINADNKIMIATDSPGAIPRLGLQSGPLLISDGKPLILAISNDEPERRIVAGITTDNMLIFMVFYREKSDFEGPLLGELPEVIQLFEKQTNIKIINAINLDGGGHSVFISNFDLLRESAIIGSYFCAR